MPNPILILNQPYVNVGLDTLTFTIPSTGIYNIQVQATLPSAVASGDGAGSGRNLGFGSLGGSQGIGQGSNLSLGQGGKGLGSGQTVSDNSAAAITYSAVSSSLVITINQNGSPIKTVSAPTPTQQSEQFKFSFPATAADAITVVLSSSNANDSTLNGVKSIVSIGQGE